MPLRDSRFALPFTVGRHVEVNGHYQKNLQDATFSAPYFLFLFLALGMTLSAAGWITIDQTAAVHRWIVEVVLMIFMTMGGANVVLFLKHLYVYSQLQEGQTSLTAGSARDFFMNHLAAIGLCIFYVCGIVLDAFPMYAHISCMWVFVTCGTSFQYIIRVLFHLWRITFKLFVVIFALNFEGRKLEMKPIIRYCVLMICLPVFCNWFDYLVYDSVDEFIKLQKENEKFELPMYCDPHIDNISDSYQSNTSDIYHCIHHNTSAYNIYIQVSKSLFPFDIEFSMIAAKILAGIYLCINLIPGSCYQEIAGSGVEAVPETEAGSETVASSTTEPGSSSTMPGMSSRTTETGIGLRTEQGTGSSPTMEPGAGTRSLPGTGAIPDHPQSRETEHQPQSAQLTLHEEQDEQMNVEDESTPMMSAHYHSGSVSLNLGTKIHDRQNQRQVQRQGSYNTFETPPSGDSGFVPGTPHSDGGRTSVVVQSSAPIFPVSMLLIVGFNVALFVCAVMSASDGYKAFTVCQFIYWIPLLLTSIMGLKAIGNEFESNFTSYSGFEVLILFSMLGAFCQLYMMLYATIGCLLGSAQKDLPDDHCSDHYGKGLLTIGLLGIILNFVQMILQTTLMAYMNHITCNNTSSPRFRCLKQCILYIAIANMVLWLVDSLVELTNPDIHPGQKMYYAEKNRWFFILHLTVPFFLFFRFNCSLVFLKTYLKFTALTNNQT